MVQPHLVCWFVILVVLAWPSYAETPRGESRIAPQEAWDLSITWSATRLVRGQPLYVGITMRNRSRQVRPATGNHLEPLFPIIVKRPGGNESVLIELWGAEAVEDPFDDADTAPLVQPGQVEYTGAWVCLEKEGGKDRHAMPVFSKVGTYVLKVSDQVHRVEVVDGESWFQDIELARCFLGSQKNRDDRLRTLAVRRVGMGNLLDQVLANLILSTSDYGNALDEAVAMARHDAGLWRALVTDAYLQTRDPRYRLLLDANVPGALPGPRDKGLWGPQQRPHLTPQKEEPRPAAGKETAEAVPDEYRDLAATVTKAVQSQDLNSVLGLYDWREVAALGQSSEDEKKLWLTRFQAFAEPDLFYRCVKHEPVTRIDGVPPALAAKCEALTLQIEQGTRRFGCARVLVVRSENGLRLLRWPRMGNLTPAQNQWLRDFMQKTRTDLSVPVRRKGLDGADRTVPLLPLILRCLGLDPGWRGQWRGPGVTMVGPGYRYPMVGLTLMDPGAPQGAAQPPTGKPEHGVALVLNFDGPVPEILGAIRWSDPPPFRFSEEVDVTKLPLPPLEP